MACTWERFIYYIIVFIIYTYELLIPYVLIPLLIGAIIQCIKILVDFFTNRKLYIHSLRWAWWFPSVHSGIAASICTMTFMLYGYWSIEFAISFCFSFLFWYDAANVRYQAWQHAIFLKKISQELEDNFPDSYNDDTYRSWLLLKERLWHTFTEVVWWVIIWWFLTRIILYYDRILVDLFSMIWYS